MSWICLNVSPELPRHPKTVQLQERVGGAALAYLIRLWAWTFEICPDGDISKYGNVEYLERQVMGWEGEPGELLKALIDLRWVDRKRKGRCTTLHVHNWAERNGHITAYRDKQRRNVQKRWESLRENQNKPEKAEPDDAQQNEDIPNGDLVDTKTGRSNTSHPSSPTSLAHPSLPGPPIHPSPAASPPIDEGALSRKTEIDLTGLIGWHIQTIKRHPTAAEKRQYADALKQVGNNATRWKHAFTKGKDNKARTAMYIIQVAQNAEPDEFGGIKVSGWDEGQANAAKQATANLVAREGGRKPL